MPHTVDSPDIHHVSVREAARLLEADTEQGLTLDEVASRQRKFGPNRMAARRGTPGWRRFLKQFTEPLILVLIAAATVMAVLGEYVDAAIIFGVVLINAIIGFIQESKAEGALEALMSMVTTEAKVRRGGERQRVSSTELVPGDVVMLESGDRVPADLRLFQVKGLQVDESALTGESETVSKHPDAVAQDAVLGNRTGNAYTGTLVTAGRGEGLVWAIADKTESGRIATPIGEAAELSTPLTRKIAQFSRLVLSYDQPASRPRSPPASAKPEPPTRPPPTSPAAATAAGQTSPNSKAPKASRPSAPPTASAAPAPSSLKSHGGLVSNRRASASFQTRLRSHQSAFCRLQPAGRREGLTHHLIPSLIPLLSVPLL